ncbi:helicase associated domain-containing protein, partial [Streptomyces sp. NPDC006283]|uniref:helicase associated domain-containing protein n=1 Tax=Streptomyces sp. NPDC006283 TaxID=3156741 RepID=UPI0033B9DC49
RWTVHPASLNEPTTHQASKPAIHQQAPLRASAEHRAQQLSAIDPDWNPRLLGWTVDWQRHHTGLRALLDQGAGLEDIQPGVTWHGDDIGRWVARQRRDWKQLNEEQQRRLGELGVEPAPPPAAAPKTRTASGAPAGTGNSASKASSTAFQRGLTALTQYIQREGTTIVSRQHVEELPDGTAVRLGVFLMNQKQRRNRLDEGQRAALANLGYTWAAA